MTASGPLTASVSIAVLDQSIKSEPKILLQCLLLISVGTMVNFIALAREHWVNILVPMGFVIGWYLDKQQDQKLTAFRNKSALFSR